MAQSKIFLGVLFGLFSCGQPSDGTKVPSNSTSKTISISKPMQADKEQWTLYSKSDKLYHVKRLVSANGNYNLLTYDINTSQPEEAHQTFISRQIVNVSELNKIKSDNASFNWAPFKGKPVLFVQMQYTHFKDQMVALNKRQEIEQHINEKLQSQALGQWIAGDIGPGGANMIFEVQDIEGAKAIILSILTREGLNKAALIGRRVNTSAEDWFYEVVYPLDYNGEFLTM